MPGRPKAEIYWNRLDLLKKLVKLEEIGEEITREKVKNEFNYLSTQLRKKIIERHRTSWRFLEPPFF